MFSTSGHNQLGPEPIDSTDRWLIHAPTNLDLNQLIRQIAGSFMFQQASHNQLGPELVVWIDMVDT